MKSTLINCVLLVIVILISSTFSNLFGQNVIVSIATNYNKTKFAELYSDNNNFYLIDENGSDTIVIDRKNIKSINFSNEDTFELLSYKYEIQKISCKLDSIGKKLVYFHDENSKDNKLFKEDVVGIFFHNDTSIINNDFEDMFSKYLQLNQNEQKQIVLISSNGNIYQIQDLISIENGKITVATEQNVIASNTSFYLTKNTQTIEFNPTEKYNKTKYKEFYFVSEEGKWTKSYGINSIDNNSISFNSVYNNKLAEFQIQKKSVKGLFFKNIKEEVSEAFIEETPRNKLYNSRKFLLSINPGFGNWYGMSSYGSLSSSENIEIQTGFAIEINLDAYISKTVAFGVKYNSYITSAKDSSNNNEHLRFSFYGGNFILSGIYGNNIGFYYTGFSIGLMEMNYSYSINNQNYKFKGTTLGIAVSPGIDYLITDNITVGINASVLYGKFNSLKDKNDNFLVFSPYVRGTHIDLMASIKFIF